MTTNYVTRKIRRRKRGQTMMVASAGLKPKGLKPKHVKQTMTLSEKIFMPIRSQRGVLQARLFVGSWEINIMRVKVGEVHHYSVMSVGFARVVCESHRVPAWYPVARVINMCDVAQRVDTVFKAG